MELKNVKLKEIVVGDNARTSSLKEGDDELLASVKTHGILQPLLVRKENGHYQLVAGHRRLAAAKAAGLSEAPVAVTEEADTQSLQLIENLQRQDMNPMDLAIAYRRMLLKTIKIETIEDHLKQRNVPGKDFKDATTMIARLVGKTYKHVVWHLRLAELPSQVKLWLRSGELTLEHGAMLIQLTAEDLREKVMPWLKRHFDDSYRFDGEMTLALLDRHIKTFCRRRLAEAPFALDKPAEFAPACVNCDKNTATNDLLFHGQAGLDKKGECRDGACFLKKINAHWSEKKLAIVKNLSLEKVPFGGFKSPSYGYDGFNQRDVPAGMRPAKNDKEFIKAKTQDPKSVAWIYFKGKKEQAVLLVKATEKETKAALKKNPTSESNREQDSARHRRKVFLDKLKEAILTKIVLGKWKEAVKQFNQDDDWLSFILEDYQIASAAELAKLTGQPKPEGRALLEMLFLSRLCRETDAVKNVCGFDIDSWLKANAENVLKEHDVVEKKSSKQEYWLVFNDKDASELAGRLMKS